MPNNPKTAQSVVLLILDGWGISPSWGGNAITMNNPDIMNLYWRTYPHTILQAFKKVVGPSGKVGNSEIGHSSIGTGRVVFQDMTRIGNSINDGSFMNNPTLLKINEQIKKYDSALHIYGLLSDGGVHSHIDHALALADFAKKNNITKTYFHITLDGRDSGTTSAFNFISQLENKLKTNNLGKIASIVGRFYSLDRDNHWSRTAVAYKAMVDGIGERFPTAEQAISTMYRKGFEDEFFPSCVITDNNQIYTVHDNDAVVCFNFRADRSRQLAKVFLGEQKLGLFFKPPKNIFYAGITSYRLPVPMPVLFEPIQIQNTLGKLISEAGFKQFHIAESEKYAHVTFFFNGGREEPYPGEDRIIVPSPDVVTYNQAPEMSAEPMTNKLLANMKEQKYQFIVANYANVDMVGHTGDITATSVAVQVIDKQVKRVIELALNQNNVVLITADHGHAEQMIGLHRDQKTETMHTVNPVPFIMISRDHTLSAPATTPDQQNILADIMQSEHTLADVAPTVLELLGLPKPADMTGNSLLPELTKS
ncbi:MAG: 2,3-bisphosphoglycerate-independent phosphoglycerate mutase [Patescibacteria group bacterium]|jgi:2,3-bisphosphoglycerate-independent phosphoglycerate mutase